MEAMARALDDGLPDQVLIHVRTNSFAGRRWVTHLANGLYAALGRNLRLDAGPWPVQSTPRPGEQAVEGRYPFRGEPPQLSLLVRGAAAPAVARCVEGTHLCCPRHGGLVPVQVLVWPVAAGEDPGAMLAAQVRHHERCLQDRARNPAAFVEDPFRPRPVVCIYNERDGMLDLRTGLTVAPYQNNEWLLRALPLPPELAMTSPAAGV
jgi:hypothetical protein